MQMSRSWRHMGHSAPGTAPGTLVADPDAAKSVVRLTLYGPSGVEERTLDTLDELPGLIGGDRKLWVDVRGLGSLDTIVRLGEIFGLHRLALEDVLNTGQRPKVEPFNDYLFVVARIPQSGERFRSEQFALFFGKGWLVSFQEGRQASDPSDKKDDCFALVGERVRQRRGRIAELGTDYLAYALLDTVIDAYFPVLEDFGERVEVLERDVIGRADRSVVARIYRMKRDLLGVRRAIWPAREVVNALIRDDDGFVADATKVFLRDCYDHTVQLIDNVETYRDISAGLIDVYLSSVNTRLNEVMKVLTVIATIFMPLSFITSLYGMNFDRQSPWNLPELSWRFGYFYALGLMAIVAFGMLVFFRRKGWLGRGWRADTETPEK
ncbi:MAG TPA: magnesium/cobalt transporter CorA [Candidatus Cybelea sp.]|nr:magnesium/cobalt transporter CorA [Candidatus Cybelea sp.]